MSEQIEAFFPGLAVTEYRITSPATTDYNCIAWAAGNDARWWWPDSFGDYYWPAQSPRAETLEAFIIAYGLLGYEPCASDAVESGYERVAIYVDSQGIPTHAARQLRSGAWTSKTWRSRRHRTQDAGGIKRRNLWPCRAIVAAQNTGRITVVMRYAGHIGVIGD